MSIIDPKEAIHNALSRSPRDMAASATDRWVWGIVVGWDEDDDPDSDNGCMAEFMADGLMSPGEVARLRQLHEAFTRLVAPPKAPAQHTALTGCVGAGDWLIDSHWRYTDVHGWRLWSSCGLCLASNGLHEPEGCTSNDAVLAAGEADHG